MMMRVGHLLGTSVVASALILVGLGSSLKVWAKDSEASSIPRSREKLFKFAAEAKRNNNDFPSIVLGDAEIYSDDVLDAADAGRRDPALFQDEAIADITDTLLGKRSKYALVIGEPGSGKTTVINEAIYRMMTAQLPEGEAHREFYKDKVVLKFPLRRFIPGGPDLKAYMETIRFMAKSLNIKIGVYFTESHFITDYNVSVLRDEADNASPIPVVLELDSKAFGNTVKAHPSFTSLATVVMVRSPKNQHIVEILKPYAKAHFDKYKITISDDMLEKLVDSAPDYRRDVAEPQRSIQLLEKFAINQHRHSNGNEIEPSRIELYRYIAKQAKLPVIPQNEEEFAEYMEQVKKEVKEELIGQDHLVDGLVEQYKAAMQSRNRQHSVALILGPTGVGKSLVGEKINDKFYKDKTRFLELDMTQFSDSSALAALFGATNGLVSSDKEKGALCDFFDGPGRGGGVVVLNEIEEMSADAFTRLMEMFDKGEFRGGDGKVRYVGRTLFLLTSNKNSDRILSYDAIKGMAKAELKRRLSLITEDQMKKAFTEKTSFNDGKDSTVKPAVLERVDGLYFASPLLKDDAIEVTKLELGRYKKSYESVRESIVTIDKTVAEVITSAFYNETLGSRQIRTAVGKFMTRAVGDFKAKYGYGAKELVVTAKLHPALRTISFVTVKDPVTGQELTVQGPRVEVENRLLDKEFRTALIELEKNIKTELFGQDEAISAAVSALKARFLQGGKGETVAGFLLGLTGSGKTELAKLIAKYLYGRAEAVGLFDMGRVQHKTDLGTIFSPGKGVIGSDEPGELETFLIQNPHGGVLLFDETSNAGGNEPGLKTTIIKQFYTMLQEGYYVNPSGKKYPLHNYLVLFTGNDGEEVFKGMQSDEFLEEAYNEAMKNPNFAEDLLRKAGMTDAFMGRLAFAHLMRPTLRKMKIMIANKMLNKWRDSVQKEQPIDLEWDEAFVEEVGMLMFSPVSGARSINKFISKALGQLVADEALKADWDQLLETNSRMKVKVSISTKKPERPFYEGEEPAKNEALLKMTLTNGTQVTEATLDFTKHANFQPTVHRNNAEKTAFHEMGHLVNSFTDVTGKKPIKVTIVPENISGGMQALGYAMYREVPRNTKHNHQWMLHNVAGLVGGSGAEFTFSDEWTAGRSNDLERVGGMIRRMILDSHLDPDFDAIHAFVNKNGEYMDHIPESLKVKFEAAVHKIIDDAKKLSDNQNKANWHVIWAGAQYLLEHGTINENQIAVLLEEGKKYDHEMAALLPSEWTQAKAAEIGKKIDLSRVLEAAKLPLPHETGATVSRTNIAPASTIGQSTTVFNAIVKKPCESEMTVQLNLKPAVGG